MWSNYLKIALRNLWRQKGYTFINVVGLSVGMATCLIIAVWITYEYSYDRFYNQADRLYRVAQTVNDQGKTSASAGTDGPLAAELKKSYPGVADAGRIYLSYRDIVIRHDDHTFAEHRVAGADESFLSMFQFPFIYGDAKTALTDPFSIVLTQSTAQKYFGDTNPVGQKIILGEEYTMTVKGVLRDLPPNTHFRFDILVPVNMFDRLGITETDVWHGGDDFYTYVLLRPDASEKKVSSNIAEVVLRHVPDSHVKLRLQPISDIHLDAGIEDEFRHLNPLYIYLFATIGLLILLVACINFINLSTARAINRGKEIGVRKVLGASRRQVMRQFLGESVYMACISGILAAGLTEVLLPFVQPLSGTIFKPETGQNAILFIVYAGMVLLTGLVAGSYPATYLSTFRPASMLRRGGSSGRQGGVLRKVLVVLQFTLSIVLIVCTLIVYRQIHFMKTQKTGYDGDRLIAVTLTMQPGKSIFSEKYGAFAQALRSWPSITSVSMAASSPADIQTSAGEATWEGKPGNRTVKVRWYSVFYGFFKTAGLKIVRGRAFSLDHPTDEIDYKTQRCAFVLNEAAVREMGVSSPIGKKFELYGKKGPIIGVVQDFHYGSLRQKIEPMAIFISPFFNRTVLIRAEPNQTRTALANIKETWQRMAPDYPFEYHFVKDQYLQLYGNEDRVAGLLGVFAILALMIACLGLFGLVSYATVQRTKEIGIRKIEGASVSNIVNLLSMDFLKLVGIGFVIAVPVAWYVMHRWLENFAYHINISAGTFVLAGILAMIIALGTISWHSVRAAVANPVDSLRSE